MGTLSVEGRKIHYRVKRGSSSKYLRLGFKRNLELEVILPRGSDLDVKRVLKKKRAWIAKKYGELVNSKGVFDGNRAMYGGTYREISAVRSRRGKGVKVKVYEMTGL